MSERERFVRAVVMQKGDGVDPGFADDDSFIEDLGMDSLVVLEVLVAIERKYGIKLPESRYPEFDSLRSALKLIEELDAA